jgi:aryl-alcohol dehydrogenase-like predicted oxidoreductase
METRRLGRTDHWSSVVTLGGAALSRIDSSVAAAAVDKMLDRGVNHIDIAPSYGDTVAERNLAGPLQSRRSSVFLACKTKERSRPAAAEDLRGSMSRLGVGHFDLYQLHAVNDLAELDAAMAPGGAIEVLEEAKRTGLTRFLGITAHGHLAPSVELEALRRFPFDTVLLPVNFVLWARPDYRADLEQLLRHAQANDVGVVAIKAIAKRPWGDRTPTNTTWYEPFTDPDQIAACVRFTLSRPITTLASSSDVRLWDATLDAADAYVPLAPSEESELLATAGAFETIF